MAHHAFRGEVWDKAVTYGWQAGAKALARSAYREAVTAVEQALVALQHLPEDRDTLAQAIELRFDLHQALVPLGEYGRLFDSLRDAEHLAETLGDQRRLGWASTLMINYPTTGTPSPWPESWACARSRRTVTVVSVHCMLRLEG